jgi:hypothetical protein
MRKKQPIRTRDEADTELRRLYAIYRRTGWPEIQAAIMRVTRLKAQLGG